MGVGEQILETIGTGAGFRSKAPLPAITGYTFKS
jgi:hypothetical protein